MTLDVIASTSTGNAYILREGNEKLLLECGIRFARIQRALAFDLSGVAGCLVTHEHKDHSKACVDVMHSGIDVYMSAGTAAAMELQSHRLRVAKAQNPFSVGAFDVLPFDTQHDAREPLGWLIRHMSTGEKVVFATDTYYIKHTFSGVTAFLVECNYCRDVLDENIAAGTVHRSRAKRLRTSHFELSNVVKFLECSADRWTSKVVLLHLSQQNSDPARMIAACGRAARTRAVIAEPGARIDLSCPF